MHSDDSVSELVYENMLLSRYALQGAPPQSRREALDRSSTVLLARLQAEKIDRARGIEPLTLDTLA